MTVVLTRWRAFALHLILSLLVFCMLAATIYFLWFPRGLVQVAGGAEGFRLIAAVDLILGPLLTLVVFNVSKPARELARDLGLIGLFQLSCLAAGMYVVYQARPLAVVFVYDTFYVLNRENYQEGVPEVEGHTPGLFYVPVPASRAEFLSEHVKSILEGEKPFQVRAELYRPFPSGQAEALSLLEVTGPAPDKGCWRLDIESAYGRGAICFDPVTRMFSDFSRD